MKEFADSIIKTGDPTILLGIQYTNAGSVSHILGVFPNISDALWNCFNIRNIFIINIHPVAR
jgi:hypothetical protein